MSVDIPVRLRFGESSGVLYQAAFARDLSAQGLGLEVRGKYPDSFDELVKTHEPLTVEVDLPDGKKLEIPAKVVWSRLEKVEGEMRFRVGLCFLEIGAREHEALEKLVKAKTFEYLFPSDGSRRDG